MKYKPTSAEMDILSILWENGPLKVKAINNIINKTKEVGYTTTLKTMQIMFDKELLTREKDGKSHIYSSNVDQEKAQKTLVNNIVDTVFGGSKTSLVMNLIGQSKTTQKELDEIRAFLDKVERGEE